MGDLSVSVGISLAAAFVVYKLLFWRTSAVWRISILQANSDGLG